MSLDLTKPAVGSTGWGEAVNNNFEDIEQVHGCQIFVYRTASLNISASTWTDIPFTGGHLVLVGGSHSTSTDPEEVTVDYAGTYLITYEVEQWCQAGAPRNQLRVLADGTEIEGSFRQHGPHSNTTQFRGQLAGSLICELSANDAVKLQVGSSNAADDVAYNAANPPRPRTSARR